MRRALGTLGLVLPLLATGAASGPVDADVAGQLMQRDREFAATVADQGLDGWLAFMADDAVRLPGLGEVGVRGKAAIAEFDGGMFAAADRKLVWDPTDAGGFADGRHGYTTGHYQLLLTVDGEDTVAGTGSYITWWRLEGDRWLVILDTGAPDRE